jgi:hypothetical protein
LHLPDDLLKPFPSKEMKAWRVGRAVGNTRNNDPSLINEEAAVPIRQLQ